MHRNAIILMAIVNKNRLSIIEDTVVNIYSKMIKIDP